MDAGERAGRSYERSEIQRLQGRRSQADAVAAPAAPLCRRWRMARHLYWRDGADQNGLEQQYAVQEAACDACLLQRLREYYSAEPEHGGHGLRFSEFYVRDCSPFNVPKVLVNV